MRRRALLSLLASGVAGCLGTPDDGADPATATSARNGSPAGRSTTTRGRSTTTAESVVERSLGESYATGEGVEVALSAPTFATSFLAYYEPHYEVRNPVGWQFVVVDAAIDGERPPDFVANPYETSTLAPVVDGERIEAPTTALYQSGYAPDGGEGVVEGLAVPFPVEVPASAAIAWDRRDGPTVRWRLDGATVAGLGRAARFAVERFAVEVRGDRVERATVTVRNEGDRDGAFRALLRVAYADRDPPIAFDVPAGETRTFAELPAVTTPRYVARAVCGDGAGVELALSPERTVPTTTTCATATPDASDR